MYDIVYLVKDGDKNEELKYSLRTLKNFPHKKVWFYGGCPKDLQPDKHVKVDQNLDNKWENVNKMLRVACNNPHITSKFWLFNDDFFIMKKVDNPTNHYNGDLYKRIVKLEDQYGRITAYSQLLRDCCKELESLGCNTKNYTLHVPMLMDKKKALEVFSLTDFPGFRSLYANYCRIGGSEMRDVKIVNPNKLYTDGIYLSTDERSFNGKLGDQIKLMFPDKSKYEK